MAFQIFIKGIDSFDPVLKKGVLDLREHRIDAPDRSNGHSYIDKGLEVHWRVGGASGVKSIAIERKEIFGTENVFSSAPPRPQDGTVRKFWKGTINSSASDLSVFVYSIKFVRDVTPADPIVYEFDPIISINPSTGIFKKLLSPILGVVVGGLATLIFWLMDRKKLNAENQDLKNRLKSKEGKREN